MINNFKQTLTRFIVNFPGWRTNRKIVVIESDDWGSIRMPSREVYEKVLWEGIRVDKFHYSRFDSLESEEDLSCLFEVLSSYKDINGTPPVITANTVVTNPDFEKIKAEDYKKYYCEPFTETFKKYPKHQNSFTLWKEGIQSGVFWPQLHGKEHVNVYRWMKSLQEKCPMTHLAFKHQTYDLSTGLFKGDVSFMDVLNFESEDELEYQKASLKEAAHIFEEIFGFKSTTFIAPCYQWSNKLNETLLEAGIKGFQGTWWQLEPLPGKENRFAKKFHYTGQRNSLGQYYLVRNAYFEPSENPDFDWVNYVMESAEIVFRFKKPLVICSHRVNYIGFIDQNNRDRNLKMLKELLSKLIKKWPDIEFMTSDRLVEIMSKE